MSIEQLKKILESERVKLAHEFRCKSDIINEDYGSFNDYQAGSKAMENRLLPLLQKAVEMATYYGDEQTWQEPEDSEYESGYFPEIGKHPKEKAREFLSEITKMTEIKKEGE